MSVLNMNKLVKKLNNCRLCNSKNLSTVLELVPTPIADKYLKNKQNALKEQIYELSLNMCNKCYHVQLSEIISYKVLYKDYTYKSSLSNKLVEHFKSYANFMIKKFNLKIDDLVLDIGSNDGTFLKNFLEKGLKVLGVDPAESITKLAKKNGIETICDVFSSKLALEIKAKKGMPKLIAANNVFAHIDDMNDVVEGIKLLLHPKGIFSFEVSYLGDILENNLFDTVYHEHLYYHKVQPIKNFLEKFELELIEVERIQEKGGSMRFIAQHMKGFHDASEKINDLIFLENIKGWNNRNFYKDYERKLVKTKEQLIRFIDNAQKKQKTIIGYGASATVTTLIYYFDLVDKLQYLVDDNPDKLNCFAPKSGLKIYSAERIYNDNPDYIIILAWNYKDIIMNKHKEFSDKGGIFIVPLPYFNIC